MPDLVLDRVGAKLGSFTLGPIDVSVSPGVTALVGVNGSGKTTLIRAMLGLLRKKQGCAVWNGLDLSARTQDSQCYVGYVPDTEQFLFPELTARQYWRFVAAVRASSFGEDDARTLERAERLAEEFRLAKVDAPIAQLSHGMRKKVEIISTCMWEPSVLILDEPQNGLDFISARRLRKTLAAAAAEGCIVLMSSHDMDSVARSATNLILLKDGVVAAVSETPFASGDECEAFAARHFSA